MTKAIVLAWILIPASVATINGSDAASTRPFVSDTELTPAGRIDELVFSRWKQLEIRPAKLCSDAVFVRRVFLDVIGTLPTLREVRAFLSDSNSDKRRVLIDRLFERDEFADYWTMRWSDLLRVKSEFPINLWPNGVQAYSRWIRTSIRDNVPYDHFARSMLTASGSNFRVPQVNFYRAMQSREPSAIAETVALTFMGMRTKRWTGERLAGMAAFFAHVGSKSSGEWKEEIIFFDSVKADATFSANATAVFPDGSSVRLSVDTDPREVFANWLTRSENPWFARSMVNRAWFWLVGRGVVHEPDDLRPGNSPSIPGLLAHLESEFVKSRYDLRQMFRLILNSRTYQLASIARSEHPEAEACFALYPIRRLDAEVLIDALCLITGTVEKYSSPIPEPFTYIPDGCRSIALADGSISSSFLELFGRPARDTGLLLEREHRPTAEQSLHLLNSSHVQRKIEQSAKLRALMKSTRQPKELAKKIYLTVLSRLPTNLELEFVHAYSRSGEVKSWQAGMDLVWALINSAEFRYRH